MKEEDIQFVKDLDKEGVDGTIQNVLINSLSAPTSYVLKRLCLTLKNEKDVLQTENKKLAQILKDNGLYTRQNILGED